MKATLFKPATTEQKKYIHQLKRRLNLDDDTYRNTVFTLTDGRTSSSADLSIAEAAKLISDLKGDKTPAEVERQQKQAELVRAIYRSSLRIKHLNADYESDDDTEKRMNYGKINNFLARSGAVKKPISRQNLEELKQTLAQFKAMEGKEG